MTSGQTRICASRCSQAVTEHEVIALRERAGDRDSSGACRHPVLTEAGFKQEASADERSTFAA
jgi:hypothetical protein